MAFQKISVKSRQKVGRKGAEVRCQEISPSKSSLHQLTYTRR